MILSDISVRRPVLAGVLSLILVILGLLAVSRLAVREFPNIDPPVVTVTTTYRGASAEVVERRVTQVIEDQISGIAGVQKLTSSSQDERSNIVIEFGLDRDPDGAANDVRERVSRVQKQLPDGANPPEITKQDQGMDATLYIGVDSRTRTLMDLTDYADRNLVDRLSAVDGVATIRLAGAQKTAMRIWLDRDALAARGLTVEDVENTLRRENVELPAGRIESRQREFAAHGDRPGQGRGLRGTGYRPRQRQLPHPAWRSGRCTHRTRGRTLRLALERHGGHQSRHRAAGERQYPAGQPGCAGRGRPAAGQPARRPDSIHQYRFFTLHRGVDARGGQGTF